MNHTLNLSKWILYGVKMSHEKPKYLRWVFFRMQFADSIVVTMGMTFLGGSEVLRMLAALLGNLIHTSDNFRVFRKFIFI